MKSEAALQEASGTSLMTRSCLGMNPRLSPKLQEWRNVRPFSEARLAKPVSKAERVTTVVAWQLAFVQIDKSLRKLPCCFEDDEDQWADTMIMMLKPELHFRPPPFGGDRERSRRSEGADLGTS